MEQRISDKIKSFTIITSIILLIGLLSIVIYQQIQLKNQQLEIEKSIVQQKELSNLVLRSMSSYASKEDIDNIARSYNLNLDEIKKDLSKLDANFSSLNKVTVVSNGYTQSNLPSDNVTNVNPNDGTDNNGNVISCSNGDQKIECIQDPLNYFKTTQYFNLTEKFSNTNIPIGNVGFTASKSKPWSVSILDRKYNLINVIGKDRDGRDYVYNKFVINVDNKDYEIKITDARTVQEYPESKISWFNPRLMLGSDFGAKLSPFEANISPNITIATTSYGKYNKQPDFYFVNIGLGYDAVSRSPNITFAPVIYNFGKHLPAVYNSYIGPSVSMDFKQNLGINLAIRVGL